MEVKSEQIFPSFPPDYVFKSTANKERPSAEVAKRYVTYLFDRVDYSDKEGILAYYRGVKWPRRGIAADRMVYAINSTKRLIVNVLKLINFRRHFLERLLVSFNDTADMTLAPYYLRDGYYCQMVKEVREFVRVFFSSLGVRNEVADKTGEIMAMIFEFDDAYRYRFQDMMSETSEERLLKGFRKEIKRLLELSAKRENSPQGGWVPAKFRSMGRIMSLLWFWPRARKAIKKGLKAVNFPKWQLDEGDVFHTLLYADYNINGKNFEERVEIYRGLYDNDPEKFPQRVEVKLNANEQGKTPETGNKEA